MRRVTVLCAKYEENITRRKFIEENEENLTELESDHGARWLSCLGKAWAPEAAHAVLQSEPVKICVAI